MAWQVALLIVSLILFILAAININAPRVSIGWLGLAFFAAYFLFGTGIARAQTEMHVGLEWTLPTEKEDGSGINTGELTMLHVLCGPEADPSGPYPFKIEVDPTRTSYSKEELLAAGLQYDTPYYCAMRAFIGTLISQRSDSRPYFLIPSESVPEPDPSPPRAPELRME